MSDASPAAGALSGALFAAIIRTTQESLFRFVCGLVEDREQARDIVQDAFVAAVRAAQRQNPPFISGVRPDDEGIRRWLFRVASNRAISFARRRRVFTWEPLESLPPQIRTNSTSQCPSKTK